MLWLSMEGWKGEKGTVEAKCWNFYVIWCQNAIDLDFSNRSAYRGSIKDTQLTSDYSTGRYQLYSIPQNKFGGSTHRILTHSRFRICMPDFFVPAIQVRSQVMPANCDSLPNIRGVTKKSQGHNFNVGAKSLFFSSNIKNCGLGSFFDTAFWFYHFGNKGQLLPSVKEAFKSFY